MITRVKLAIVLSLVAATALAQLAPGTTTTTVTAPCSGPSYASVLCQQAMLRNAVQTSTDFTRSQFQALLLQQLDLLGKRISKAEGKKGKSAKNWLKGAVRLVITFNQRLNSHTGKNSVGSSTRIALNGMASTLKNDLTALRAATQ